MVKGVKEHRSFTKFLSGNDLPLGAVCRSKGYRGDAKCLVMTVGGSEKVLISLASGACKECCGRMDCRWHREVNGVGGMKDIVEATNKF